MLLIKFLNEYNQLSSITSSDREQIKNIICECIDKNYKFVTFDSDDRFADILIHRPEFVSLEAHNVPKKDKVQDRNLKYFFDYIMSI